jgi:DNA-binding transcriptional LysR family regulator
MPSTMPDWDHLRFFLALCRHGSFAAAARTLKVDETTVSRRLGALERQLEAKLFERTAQGLMPTVAAERIQKAAEMAEAALLGVVDQVAGLEGHPSGFVRVTMTETVASHFVIPSLGAFQARYPDIRLEIFTGYGALDVARGEADIGVRALRPVGNHLVVRRLGSVALGVYAAVSYLARRPAPRFEDGLAGHDLLDYSDRMSPRPPGDPFLGARTDGARLVFTGNSPMGLTAAAEAGLGIATLPCYLANRRPGLRRLWPNHSQRYDLLAVTRAELRRSARIRAVLEHLVQHFRAGAAMLEGRQSELASGRVHPEVEGARGAGPTHGVAAAREIDGGEDQSGHRAIGDDASAPSLSTGHRGPVPR